MSIVKQVLVAKSTPCAGVTVAKWLRKATGVTLVFTPVCIRWERNFIYYFSTGTRKSCLLAMGHNGEYSWTFMKLFRWLEKHFREIIVTTRHYLRELSWLNISVLTKAIDSLVWRNSISIWTYLSYEILIKNPQKWFLF